MAFRPGDVLIDDDAPPDVAFDPRFARGLVPRDYSEHPREMFAPPAEIALVPRSEWDARIDEQEEQKSSLEHLYLRAGWENLDQGQVGYCWAHSTVHSVMLARTRDNQPFVPLSAYAVAATIKGGRDEGGWCGLSAKFVRDRGVPSQAFWPQGDRGVRARDRPEVWENAGLHKITEDWVDLTRDVYDQSLSFDQVATCLLQNVPCPVDFNWWAHSVCAVRLVRVEAGSYGLLILNSWKNWGRRGLGVLRGRNAIPDGALATRVVGASVA